MDRKASFAIRATLPIFFFALGFFGLSAPAKAADLSVGPTRSYTTILAAVNAAKNGDRILVDPGTYNDNAVSLTKSITIMAAQGPGTVIWRATQNVSNRKALLVVNADVTVDGIAFTNAKVAESDGANGAGIRYESGKLTIKRCLFRDNQDGMLAGAGGPSDWILIQDSWFDHNGVGTTSSAGYGYTHNLYVNNIPRLEITNSLFTNAVVGHGVKSRALTTIITNSRILDLTGNSSYSIDLPNAGAVTLTGNIIQQSANSQNPIIVNYGEEGNLINPSSLLMTNNTIINEKTNSPSVLGLSNNTSVTAALRTTTFYGLTMAQFVKGPNTQNQTIIVVSKPAYSTAAPWTTVTATNGACGSSNGQSYANPPEVNLCTAGTPSAVTGTGPFNWTCAGSNGGTTASCSATKTTATINGACGTANGVGVSIAPTANLCKTGTSTAVTTGATAFSWNCAGNSGGTTAACSVPKLTVTNGSCGAANGTPVLARPTVNLCNTGMASAVTGAGPFAWTCAGTNGGTAATCSAPLGSAPPTQSTIFENRVPTVVDIGDTASLELGVKFSSSVAGQILGVRYYKAPTNTSAHTVSLWSPTGARLAGKAASGETASGWQSVLFDVPVSINANQIYVASYHSQGHYADDRPFFVSSYSNGSLTVPANGGVFYWGTGIVYPTSTYGQSNYWVDVIFAPGR